MKLPYRGYPIALIAFLSTGLSIGMSQYAFGQFATPLQEEFGWTKTQLNGALSLAFVSGITGPILGKAADKYGIKIVLLISLLLISSGFLLRPTISHLWQWYFYSGLVYAGFPGATHITSGKMVSTWFPKTRGRVMGAVTSGNNFGGFTMPALAASIIAFSNWELAFIVFGSIMLFLGIFSYFIISESLDLVESESIRTNKDLDSISLAKKQSKLGFEFKEALRSFRFWTINLSLMIGVLTYQARKTLILSMFFQTIGTIVLCIDSGEILLWIGCFIYGLGFGAFGALIPLIIVEQFGMKNLGSLMGINLMLTSITMAIGPLVAGMIHDQTGSYRNAFLGISILFILAIILVWLSKFGKGPSDLDVQ